MQIHIDITGRFRIALAMAILTLVVRAAAFAEPVPGPAPVQAHPTPVGWVERQRIRYQSAPIKKQIQQALAAQDYARTESYLRQWMALDPANPYPAVLLMDVYEESGDLEKGIAWCDQVLAAHPLDVEAARHKAFMAVKLGQPLIAIDGFLSTLQALPFEDPHREKILGNLAQLWCQAGDDERAATAGSFLLSRKDTVARRLFLADCRRRQARWAEAAEQLEHVLMLKLDASQDLECRVRLVECYIRMGRNDRALAILSAGPLDAAGQARAFNLCLDFAQEELQGSRFEHARAWLDKAQSIQRPDERWRRIMAESYYSAGDYRGCLKRLYPPAPEQAWQNRYVAFCFQRLGMPGLALHYFQLVRISADMLPAERRAVFANRAYLLFEQDQDRAALADVDRALDEDEDLPLQRLRLKLWLRLGYAREVREEARDLADRYEAPELAAVLGLSAFQLEAWADAIACFSRVLEQQPSDVEARYLRGLAYYRQGHYREAAQDFVAIKERPAQCPALLYGDLALTEAALGRHPDAADLLARYLTDYTGDVKMRAECGYQNMKANRTARARDSFRQAIDFYSCVMPYLPPEKARTYDSARLSMKQEYGKLDKIVGAQAYLSRTDYGQEWSGSTLYDGGAMPSQAGLTLSWRPPEIGFRDEKTFDLFARGMANFQPHLWRFDPDSYQGGVGALYKPFSAYNVNVSFERLIRIGDNAEDNWLWRNMASWERGEKPVPGQTVGVQRRLYGEISYFLESPSRWIYYLDGRAGFGWTLDRRLIVTVPQVMGIARYQSSDPLGQGSYVMAGPGLSARWFEGERSHTVDRWYLDAFLFYTWCVFEQQPETLSDRQFDGVLFGVSLTK